MNYESRKHGKDARELSSRIFSEQQNIEQGSTTLIENILSLYDGFMEIFHAS